MVFNETCGVWLQQKSDALKPALLKPFCSLLRMWHMLSNLCHWKPRWGVSKNRNERICERKWTWFVFLWVPVSNLRFRFRVRLYFPCGFPITRFLITRWHVNSAAYFNAQSNTGTYNSASDKTRNEVKLDERKASWTVHAYRYRPETGLWSASMCGSKGILLDASTSSFLAEALALESALEFVDSFL